MNSMNPGVDRYLAEGCMRCPLGGTPRCKVHNWTEELKLLRGILLDCGLVEEVKWSVPTYTFEGANVLIMSALVEYCALGFFKGVLLNDPAGALITPTRNTQAERQLRFTSVDQVREMESTIRDLVREAIEAEKAGLKVPYKKTSDFEVPEELQARLDDDPAFRTAFEALTPGRQRGYLLHFAAAKRSETRASRIEKCAPLIFEGRGLHDR